MGRMFLALGLTVVGLAFFALIAALVARAHEDIPALWYEDDDGFIPPPV